MKKIFLFVLALTLFSNFSLAEKFIVGEFYQSTIKNVFNTGHAVSLPPGKWEATDVEINGEWAYIDFENSIDNANFYVSMPSSQIQGDYWIGSGIKPCRSKDEDGDKYRVHASGVKREVVQVAYCIQDVEWSGGNKDLNISIEAETTSAPLTWMKYNVYYDLKNSNVSSFSKNELKKIGNSLIKVLKDNIRGKPGNYSEATQLLKFANTSNVVKSAPSSSSLSNISDMVVCAKAITLSGNGWDSRSAKIEYVKEAKSRKLTIENCRSLTGRLDYVTSKTVVETTLVESGVKDKLEELKLMLDAGLISQELYDTKSSKLLEDF